MKVHTSNFKEQIKLIGKEIDSKITFGDTVLGKEELNSVTPSYQGAILKSVMKQLDIDSNIEIPVGTILKYEFGVKVDGEYEYLNFGNYVVKEVEKQEDISSYKVLCYDKILYTMKNYTTLQNGTFPMTVRDYINNLCLDCGLTFKNTNDEFANYDKVIESDLYANLGYNYRDIFDELAQVTASTICLDDNDEVEIRYITETDDTIDEEYLKDVNVNFGEKYGPINSIVLSRSAESDNVYLQDEVSIATNGLCELKIIDNQIMNWNDRSDYLPDILEKINGLEYHLNDFTSTGITYYDVCDKYTIKIGDNTYSCVMFNDEINVTQGLEENIFTEMLQETETDYTKADKTDRKINQTYLIVDKQNQEIQALASKIEDISATVNGIGSITLENASETDLYKLIIKNASQIFPNSQQYPNSTLYSTNSNLVVEYEDETKNIIELPNLNLLTFESVSDDLTIENGQVILTKRINMDSDGNLSLLDESITTNLGQVFIPLKEGINKIYLESIETPYLEVTYLLKNQYTDVFASQAEVSSQIKVTTDNILLESKSYTDTATEGDALISKINLDSTGNVKINASRTIDLTGSNINLTADSVTISSNGFSVSEEGNISSTSGIIGGWHIEENALYCYITPPYDYTKEDVDYIQQLVLEDRAPTTQELEKYDFNKDGILNSLDMLICQKLITYNLKNTNPGKLIFDTTDWFKPIKIINSSGEIVAYFGVNGVVVND